MLDARKEDLCSCYERVTNSQRHVRVGQHVSQVGRKCTSSPLLGTAVRGDKFPTSLVIAAVGSTLTRILPWSAICFMYQHSMKTQGVDVEMIASKERQELKTAAMPSPSTDSESRGWRLIRTRDFGLLWWGQVTSQIGEGLNKVALLWFVYELTGSAMMIAMVGMLQTIPPLVFGPIIGVYLDRLRKKPVMVWVDLI